MEEKIRDLIDSVSLSDVKKGYSIESGPAGARKTYRCLYCGEKFEEGRIYQINSLLFDAETAVVRHVDNSHGGPFLALIEQGKRLTGFSEIQRRILSLLYEGLSDREIASVTGGKAPSTIRNHRFQLRRRRREALLQLAALDLLEEEMEKKSLKDESFHRFSAPLTISDDRTIVTEGEEKKIADRYLEFSEEGKILFLRKWPKKQKEKLVVLDRIARIFSSEIPYTEKEVNEILMNLHDEYVTIRRYMVDYGFFERKPGGGPYRRKKA